MCVITIYGVQCYKSEKVIISAKWRYVCSEFWGIMPCVSLGYKAGKACQLCGRREMSVLVVCLWLCGC